MAHQIDMTNNRANMAFVGELPWHGLGYEIKPDATVEEWQAAAGMNFKLESFPATYYDPVIGGTQFVENKRVLIRDDSRAQLSVVSDSYKVVQPREVLEFYRDIVSAAGFKLNTAGVLFGGRKYWALAEIGSEAKILGQDDMKGYLLLATSCDMTLATTAAFTSVRVVCNNTLGFAMDEVDNGKLVKSRNAVKVNHNATFDPSKVKAQMGIAASDWNTFIERANLLAKRKVSNKEAIEWLVKVYGDATKPVEEQTAAQAATMRKVMALFEGHGLGSNFASADGTAWGLVNAVTEFTDHRRGSRTVDSRLDSAWFGDGAVTKQKAWDSALALV